MVDEKTELKCTCDLTMQADQYIMSPCPIHGQRAPIAENQYGETHAVITDQHLISKDTQFISGYRFTCPNCGEGSVMHYMKGCPNCLTPVVIQSDFVRNIIRQINARGRSQMTTNPNTPK